MHFLITSFWKLWDLSEDRHGRQTFLRWSPNLLPVIDFGPHSRYHLQIYIYIYQINIYIYISNIILYICIKCNIIYICSFIHVYIYVCMYVCIYIYICIHVFVLGTLNLPCQALGEALWPKPFAWKLSARGAGAPLGIGGPTCRSLFNSPYVHMYLDTHTYVHTYKPSYIYIHAVTVTCAYIYIYLQHASVFSGEPVLYLFDLLTLSACQVAVAQRVGNAL